MKTKVEEKIIIKPLKEILNMIDKDKYNEILEEALDNFDKKKKLKITKEDQEGYIAGDMLAKYISLLILLNSKDTKIMKEIIKEKKVPDKNNELYIKMIDNNIIFNIEGTHYLSEEIEKAYEESKNENLDETKIKALIIYYMITNGLLYINKLVELIKESGFNVTKKDVLEVVKENKCIVKKDIVYFNDFAEYANKDNKLAELKELLDYKIVMLEEAVSGLFLIEEARKLEDIKKILKKTIKNKDKLESILETIFNVILLNDEIEEKIELLLEIENIDLKKDEEEFCLTLEELAHMLPSWKLNGFSEHELFCMDDDFEELPDFEEFSDEEKKEVYIINYVGINGIITIDKLLEILNNEHNLKTTKKDIIKIAKKNELSIIENYVCIDDFKKEDFLDILALKKHKEYKIVDDVYELLDEVEENQMELECILEEYDLNESTKEEIINLIRMGMLSEDILPIVLECNKNPMPLKKQHALYKDLKRVINTTRNWMLNGFTYEEISKSKITKEKVGRNDLCPCGSGLKYKKCCGK